MRLLVVEDDPDLNRQLATALTDAGYVVDRAFDGEEGHYLGETEPYDAVILDIGLPKMDGISVLEAWRRAGRAMPVLMLTARDRWSDKVQGFDAGADDYVAKPFHLEEVLARVRALLRRSAGHAKSEFTCGPVRLDTRTGRVTVDGNPVKLTCHEYRLLAYLMHHTGRVVSRTELVEHLYDQDFDRDSNTIEVFVGRIRKKLGVDVIQTVRGLGYLLDRRPSELRSTRDACALTRSRCACSSPRPPGRWSSCSSPASCCPRSIARRWSAPSTAGSASICARWSPTWPRPTKPSDKFPQSLGEPLFELPLSGWYWQVTRLDPDKPDVRSSRSLWDGGLPHLQDLGVAADAGGSREGYVDGPEDQRLRLVERTIDLGEDGRYLVAVAGDAAEIDGRDARLRPGAGRHLRRCWPSCCCSPPCSRCASALRRSSASPTALPRSAPAPPSGWRASSPTRSRRWRARPMR